MEKFGGRRVGCNDAFFEKKKPWSFFKDRLLSYYLVPYTAKILTSRKPLVFIDCFAGKGRFDDGNPGSPIIFAENIKKSIENEYNPNKNVSGIFIEKEHVADLDRNLKGYKNCIVKPGTFEENLEYILKLDSISNLFLYVDPYGIKSLDFNRFRSIQQRRFNTLELLLNFNSFGFLREGCRLLKYENILNEIDNEEDYEIDSANDIGNMNRIANGDYWQQILNDYNSGKMRMHQAEEVFVGEYLNRLRQIFKYAIDVPIKTKARNIPKYRMVFATNKDDGIFLMSDIMNKVFKDINENNIEGQMSFFDFFPEADVEKMTKLESYIMGYILSQPEPVLLRELIVKMIEKHGIIYRVSEYKDAVKRLENKSLKVTRKPEYTEHNKKATSLDFDKYEIRIELRDGWIPDLLTGL